MRGECRKNILTGAYYPPQRPSFCERVRRSVFRECARVVKPGGRFVLVDSLQHGDQPDYDGLLDVFRESYHEPYYRSYLDEDFGAIAKSCGLTHVRDVTSQYGNVV